MRAAARAGVRRVVFTSSAASVGEHHGTVGDERSVHRGSDLSVYDRSKHEGEQAAFAAADWTGVELVAICPSSVQGPGRKTGNGKLILDYLNGKLPAFVDTYVSVVDIADCTEAHVLAAERGRAGARYVLNGATITSGEALALIAELSGVRRPVRIVRPAVARSAAALLEAVYAVRGRTLVAVPRAHPHLPRTATGTMARWRRASWSRICWSARPFAARSNGRWGRVWSSGSYSSQSSERRNRGTDRYLSRSHALSVAGSSHRSPRSRAARRRAGADA